MFTRKQCEITVSQVLTDAKPGRRQSVAYMQVVPLLCDVEDTKFVSPVDGQARVFTTSYGSMVFENIADAFLIVPCHAGYVTRRAAQDHAMTHAGLVDHRQRRTFDTAACIQEMQGGLISNGGHELSILPCSLRQHALRKRRVRDYSKLWRDIFRFNGQIGIDGHAHLEYFLRRFKKELDEFVAEFESLPRQIGAIILVDDRVVGIERAPSYAYWESVWPGLIRECYGSLAIEVAQAKRDLHPLCSRLRLSDRTSSLDELADALADLAAREREQTDHILQNLMPEAFAATVDEQYEGLTLETLKNDRFAGQIVRNRNHVVYGSIFSASAGQ